MGEAMITTMTESQLYRCRNRGCGCEIRVIKASIESNANPRCCCGAEMKRPYAKPVLRTLDSPVGVVASPETDRE
jgi:hypothetical protein